MKSFVMLCCLCSLASVAVGQTTYTWNQTSAAAYGTAANWTPTRATPAATDILVFDGTATPNAVVTGLSTQTIGQLNLLNGARVVLVASATATLTIGGGTGTDFTVGATSTLVDSANSAITITLSTGVTGSVAGTFWARGSTAATAHKLTATDASSISFESGSLCYVDTLSSGNLFGTTALNSIVFKGGSVFAQKSGSNPFGASAPNSVVSFQAGSKFRVVGNFSPAFSGRTYPNFELNCPWASISNATGGSALSIDTLTMVAGLMNLNLTGAITIKGDINVGLGDTLGFSPASNGTLNLAGSVSQAVSGSGVLNFGSKSYVKINNTAGVVLNKAITMNDTLALTAGAVSNGTNLTMGNGTSIVVTGGSLAAAPTLGTGVNIIYNGSTAQTTGQELASSTHIGTLTINNAGGVTLGSSVAVDTSLTFTAGKLTGGSNTVTLGVAAKLVGVGSGKFVDGKVVRTIAAPGQSAWPIGQSTDYLPVTIYTGVVTTPGAITIQALDKTGTPFTGSVQGAVQVLKRYFHTTGDANLNFTVDSIGITYAAADIPSGVFASGLQVVRGSGYPWINTTTVRIDSAGNVIVVGGNTGPGDYIVTGPAGFLAASKTSINYGTVLGGQTKVDSVIITNTGNASLSVDSLRSTAVEFTFIPTSASIPAGGSVTFKITYAPLTAGAKAGSIVFFHSGINGKDSVAVTGGVSMIANFAATPDSIDFGTIVRNTSKVDSVVVANSGNIALVIDSVRSTATEFSVYPSSNVSIAAGGTGKFYMTYAPKSAGAKSGKLVFYDNSQTGPDTVYAKGDVVIAPMFSVAPKSLAYGAVLLGHSKKDSVVVTNTGTSSLNIGSVVSTDTNFVVTPGSATLAVDQSATFSISFAPKVMGSRSALIVFSSNASEGTDTIRVHGTGTMVVTIAEARKDANGDLIADHSITKDTLMIYGIVTSLNLQASGSQTAYFIQDSTGGIEIFAFSLSPTFLAGDSVFAVGTVAMYRGLTEFIPLGVDSANFGYLKHNAAVPKPKVLTLHQYVSSPETYEGQLIEVDSLYKVSGTWPAAGINAGIYLTNRAKTDTVQMFIDFDTNIDGTTEPQYPINVVGLASQYSSGSTVYNNGYEIVPRDTTDIAKTRMLPVVTIAEARKDLNSDLIPDHSVTKDSLTIYGVITSPNFQGTQCAYFVQDTSGGIQVFSSTPSPTTFAIGDSVFVTGKVSQYRGLTEFVPLVMDADHFGLVKHNAVVPKPKLLPLHQFVSNPEAYEGLLIELDTLYKASGTWPATGANGYLYLRNASKTDTVLMFVDLDTDVDGTAEPQFPINVVGIASQYSSGLTVLNNGYEIVPRDTTDYAHVAGLVKVDDQLSGIPTEFELSNNFPNPFNPSTAIQYGLPVMSRVSLKMFSLLGQEIATLVDGVQTAGYHRIVWEGKHQSGGSVASGVYFYRIVAEPTEQGGKTFVKVMKMILLR